MSEPLPIDAALPEVLARLNEGARLVLVAPPGAGKTTRMPLALLDQAWRGDQKILLLEPRRIAARMAAERMARTLGEDVGERVGLSTRIERRVSKHTRIEVMTDGLFVRRILDDPALDGVGAVLFDEFHERSLNHDLGLALALDSAGALRPDLRLVVMSATLDAGRVAKAIAAPIVTSEGRAHPVETIYLGRGEGDLIEHAARAVRRALGTHAGSILAFMPGASEIRRLTARLGDLPTDIQCAPLYGALSPAEQDLAIAPARPGARKVVIATDIAESALTIEGVSVVIDSGLARIAERGAGGAARLVTRRAARANVDQRRGRAGRLGPGVCYRLWDEAETRGLAPEPAPEITREDLTGLVLALAVWGERDPARLVWIDPPSEGRLAAARAELQSLGAIEADGAIAPIGRAFAALPLEPRLAAMIVAADDAGDKALAAEIAALLSEPGLGGESADVRLRIEQFRRDRSARAGALRRQAERWGGGAPPAGLDAAGRIIARALPIQIARRRPGDARRYLLASGEAAELNSADGALAAPFLAVAAATGAASSLRILAAAPIAEEDARRLGPLETEETAAFDAASRSLRARRITRLGAIVLDETPAPTPSGAVAHAALLDAVRASGLDLLADAGLLRAFQSRLAFARAHGGAELPDLSDDVLLERAQDWLAPLFGEPAQIDRPNAADLAAGAMALLDWPARRLLDDIAPLAIVAPSGRRLSVDYAAPGGPRIEARVQEFFGARAHPMVARGRMPLTVSFLSPARRQIALTRDIPAFWSGGYRDMAKDMRSEYPKHDWPERPDFAEPHEGLTKARLARDAREASD